MESGGEHPGQHRQQGHGNHGDQGELRADIGHAGQSGAPHDGGIGAGDQTHAPGQLHRSQVVGGQSHDRAHRFFLKKGAVQSEEMAKKTSAQVAFDQPGKTENQITPDKTAAGNANGQQQNGQSALGQGKLAGRALGQEIHRSFHQAGDAQLEKINGHQGEKPADKAGGILANQGTDKAQGGATALRPWLLVICHASPLGRQYADRISHHPIVSG